MILDIMKLDFRTLDMVPLTRGKYVSLFFYTYIFIKQCVIYIEYNQLL